MDEGDGGSHTLIFAQKLFGDAERLKMALLCGVARTLSISRHRAFRRLLPFCVIKRQAETRKCLTRRAFWDNHGVLQGEGREYICCHAAASPPSSRCGHW